MVCDLKISRLHNLLANSIFLISQNFLNNQVWKATINTLYTDIKEIPEINVIPTIYEYALLQ